MQHSKLVTKHQLLMDLGQLYTSIDSNPPDDDEEFWLTMEALTKVAVFVEALPESTITEIVGSSTFLQECANRMVDWSDGVAPMGGWPDHLISRLRPRQSGKRLWPLMNASNAYPEQNEAVAMLNVHYGLGTRLGRGWRRAESENYGDALERAGVLADQVPALQFIAA